MRLAGRFGLVCAKLAAAGFLLTGAAACAGVAAAPAAVPQGSAAPGITAPAGYNLLVDGSVMSGNTAREGGGAIFFVVDADGGTLTIDDSTLSGNSSGAFQNAPGIFDEVNSVVTQPAEAGSLVS